MLSVVAMCVSNPDRSPVGITIADTQPQLNPALGIVDHLRRRFPRFNLRAHLLDLRCLLVETRSKLFNGRLLLREMET